MTKIFPYNQEVEDQIKKIKLALRVHMNGEVSDNMTRKGLEYKLNYGTLLPELKEASKKFTPHKLLAERLWHLRIRETMILATYLYPSDEFQIETAEEWMITTPTQEIAEICSMNLFSKLSYAGDLISKWIDNSEGFAKLYSWLLLIRRFKDIKPEKLDEYIHLGVCSMLSENKPVKSAILSAFKRIGAMNPYQMLKAVDNWQYSDDTRVFYEEIKEELNF